MKFIALEIENSNAASEDFQPHLKAEAQHVWDLQQQGFIRETYFRSDQHTAVLVLECENLSHAKQITAAFPLVQLGLIHFDIIPLTPYTGFSRLFA